MMVMMMMMVRMKNDKNEGSKKKYHKSCLGEDTRGKRHVIKSSNC